MSAASRNWIGGAGARSVGSAARAFHAIDVENLVGSGHPDEGSVAALRSAYLAVMGVTPLDQMVVACNRGSLVDVGFGWGAGHARYRVGVGRDGADWELLGVLECEGVADRFRHVVIGSGDGIFAPMAARLAAAGCEVTVVSRRGSLSTRLELAARRVVYLPEFKLSAVPVPVVGRDSA
jgi:NYN domain